MYKQNGTHTIARNRKEYNYSEVTENQVKQLQKKYPSEGFWIENPQNIKTLKIISGDLVDIYDSIVVQVSGSNPLTSGVLTQHGDWAGRTTTPEEAFWTHISSSGIGDCYPISELPDKPSGSLNELTIESQKGALTDLVKELRRSMRSEESAYLFDHRDYMKRIL